MMRTLLIKFLSLRLYSHHFWVKQYENEQNKPFRTKSEGFINEGI